MPNIYLVVGGFILAAYLLIVLSSGIETAVNYHRSCLKSILTDLADIFVIIFKALFVHRITRRTLKHLQQIGLYLLEIFIVCGICLIIENWLYPMTEERFWYELFTRFIGVYTFYQIFVFSVLNLMNSATYDEWLAIVRVIKLKQLYFETGAEYVKDKLDYLVKDALDPQTFMTGKPKKLMIEVKNCEDPLKLKYYLVLAEHKVQALNSYWHFSYLLSRLK